MGDCDGLYSICDGVVLINIYDFYIYRDDLVPYE